MDYVHVPPRAGARPVTWICVAIVSLFACKQSGPEPPSAQGPQQGASPAPPPTSSACTADSECNFADPCQPERCVASPVTAACRQPTTPGGSCVCFEGTCALRPSSPRISKQACRDTGDCAVDVATARCEPGIETFRVRYVGPTCSCSASDQRCHLRWFDPIPCDSVDDCWVDEQPAPHAIQRPRRLKGRIFRGCVDGERVPACVDRRCTLRALMC